MAEREIDLLGEAIAGTEMEIFGESTGGKAEPLDNSGDRSFEEMGEGLEGQNEPEEVEQEELKAKADDESEEQVEAKAEDETPRDEKGRFEQRKEGNRVPVSALREERDKRQAVEAEREALKAQVSQGQSEFVKLQSQLEMLGRQLAAIQQPPQRQPEKPVEQPLPDPITDPEGFARSVDMRNQQRFMQMQEQMESHRIETSMQNARMRHGENFDKAYSVAASLRGNPQGDMLLQQFRASPDPGEALVTWHRQQEAIRQIGPDPAAFKAKTLEEAKSQLMQDPEFRKQLLDSMRADAQGQNGSQPRTTTRLPKSLNGASGSGATRFSDPSAYDNSEKGVFEGVFDS